MLTKFKKSNDFHIIFAVVDKILWKTTSVTTVSLENLNECTLYGKILMCEELVNGELKWNKSYGPSVVCNGNLSIILKLEMKSVTDVFDYFIKASNFSNIKLFFETFLCSDDFKNTNIEAISCPYNNTISDYCKIKTDDEQQQNSDKKLKCKVPGCKYKKDISIVKMRLHIAWHIMNKDFKDDSHRCGYCGVVGCTTMHINH